MSSTLISRRQDFYKALVECITQLTDVPVGLYEFHDGQVEEIIPETSRANYEKYCKLIQGYQDGKMKCEADQLKRAKAAFNSNKDRTKECCWAGVYNERVPIKINGRPTALLVYGEMQLNGEQHKKISLTKHLQAVSELKLTDAEASILKQALFDIKEYCPQKFAKLEALISKAEQWMHAVVQEEKRAKEAVEKNAHEINTRLQSVIAYAENLVSQIQSSEFSEATETAESLLNSAESLDTVVQNLGDYLEEYQFKRQSLTPIVDQAIKLYEAEAFRRGIDLIVRLNNADHPSHWVDVSRRHLQYAVNNLIHNSIKYSFRGINHYRYVNVEGQPEKNYYRLSISNYGVGILPEEHGKIFEDGYQGKLTRGEYRTGSGKGLRFVKRTIEAHHGMIEVESRLRSDKETPGGKPHINKFIVWLPYHQL